MIEKIKKNYKSLVYIFFIAVVLAYTFTYSMNKGMHHVIPEAVNRHTNCISVAISDLEYGLTGYRGYQKVMMTLINNGIFNKPYVFDRAGKTIEETLNDSKILNNAFQEAINVDNASSDGQRYLFAYDKGLPVYYKLAFMIFGYNIEGFFYLYFLLLLISVLIFIFTFYKRIELLNILLLFVASHFLIVAGASSVGMQLKTVHNARFLPVLAILPTIYLALLILGKHRFAKGVLAGAFLQASILVFIVHIRGGTIYQLMFLATVFILVVIGNWFANRQIGVYAFKKVRFYPLGVVLLVFFILSLHQVVALKYPYGSDNDRRSFWHPAYLGLSAHPDSMAKYGIEPKDSVGANVVRKRLVEDYGTEVSFSQGLSDSILKEEFFKILKEDPWFVIKSYLYKAPMFIKSYFSFYFGAVSFPFKLMLFLIVVIGSLLGGKVFLRKWFTYFCLFFLGLLFSLLPPFIHIPHQAYIAESALLFTMVIYLIAIGTIYSMVKRVLLIMSLKLKKE